MSFEIRVALRYFKSGGMQSVLTVLGVSIGVAVSIFIACLIAGVQDGLIKRIIGSLSQVTLEAKESIPLTMAQISPNAGNDTLLITRVEKSGQKEARIGEWKPLVEKLDEDRALTAVSPTVSGPGFAIKGNQVLPITFRGVEPERANKITDLKTRLKGGVYDVSGQNCVIGVELAKEMGLRLKDKLRTRSGKGRELVFTVTGIFDVGINEINLRSFYISLSNAQRLLDLVGYVNAIEMKIADIFQANEIADRLGAMSGLKQQSWMRQQKEFLSAFQAQNGSNNLIRVFMMLAVAFGIASVLVVSVVQKSREIGILKSMGARTRSIMLIFMIQGLLTGLIGSLVGTGLGVSLCWGLMQIPGDNMTAPGQLFPMKIVPEYIFQAIGAAVIVGVVASIAPARRAATLDPVEVIRYG